MTTTSASEGGNFGSSTQPPVTLRQQEGSAQTSWPRAAKPWARQMGSWSSVPDLRRK